MEMFVLIPICLLFTAVLGFCGGWVVGHNTKVGTPSASHNTVSPKCPDWSAGKSCVWFTKDRMCNLECACNRALRAGA
jgi:hypothetical protein